MVNRIRTVDARGLNKGFSLKFCVGSWVQHETPEKAKGCINQNIVNITMKKFRQIYIYIYIYIYMHTHTHT